MFGGKVGSRDPTVMELTEAIVTPVPTPARTPIGSPRRVQRGDSSGTTGLYRRLDRHVRLRPGVETRSATIPNVTFGDYTRPRGSGVRALGFGSTLSPTAIPV